MNGMRGIRRVARRALAAALVVVSAAVGVVDDATAQSAPPVMRSENQQFHTEWVWLLWSYDKHLERLARAVTDKYREGLAIPGGYTIMAQHWMVFPPPIDPKMIVERRACAESAQREFLAGKTKLDKAFADAFANWTKAAYAVSPQGAVTVWRTVEDLRRLRHLWFGSGRPGEANLNLRALLAKDTSQRIGGALETAAKPLLTAVDRQLTLLPAFVREKIKSFATDSIAQFEEKLRRGLTGILAVRDPAELDGMILALTAWGDVVLDGVAYPSLRMGPQQPGADPRGLGGFSYPPYRYYTLVSHPPFYEERQATVEYNTGFAIKWNFDHLLLREYPVAPIRYAPRQDAVVRRAMGSVRLDAHDVARLVQGAQIAKRLDQAGPLDRAVWMKAGDLAPGDFHAAVSRYQQVVQSLTQRGAAGEAAWWAAVTGPDRARAASAIRLLQADLARIVQEWDEEKVSLEVRKWAITRAKGAFAKAPAYLGPLTGVIDHYFNRLVEYQSRDLREEFRQQLDAVAIRVAVSIVPPPAIPAVLADRETDPARLLALEPGNPCPPVQARGCKPGCEQQGFICENPELFVGWNRTDSCPTREQRKGPLPYR